MLNSSFDNQNLIISGGENNLDIPAFQDEHGIITCWKLNKEELDLIAKTGTIYLRVAGNTWTPLAMFVASPFRKLNPIIVNERITQLVKLLLVDDEEIILLKINEGECNFQVITNDEIWYHLMFRVRNSVDYKWHKAIYSFKEPVEIIGLGSDCPEYWWLFHKNAVVKETTLVLKRVNKSE